MIFVELRPRLRVANVYVHHVSKEKLSSEISIEMEGSVLSIRKEKDSPTLLSWHWPSLSSQPELVPAGSRPTGLKVLPDQDEILFRLQFQTETQKTELLASDSDHRPEKLTSWSTDNRTLKILPSQCVDPTTAPTLGIFQIHCSGSGCKSLISEKKLQLLRILPLPSISWKEFSQAWFCGCVHPKHDHHHQEEEEEQSPAKTELMPNKKLKAVEALNPTKRDLKKELKVNPESQEKNDSVVKNNSLVTHSLEPRSGDLLFAPGFICLNFGDTFGNTPSSVCQKEGSSSLSCSHCQRELGRVEGTTAQIWEHAVQFHFDPPKEAPSPSLTTRDTFLDLFNGVVSECPEQMIKIYFTGGTQNVLVVWVVEKELLLYTDAKEDKVEDQDPDPRRLQLRPVRKLLFQVIPHSDNEWKKDFRSEEVVVNDDLVKAGLDLLIEGQICIPTMYRRDGPWKFSVLDNNLQERSSCS